MEKNRGLFFSIIFKSIWFIVFIIFLIIANLLISTIPNPIYRDVINFLNLNLALFFVIFFADIIRGIFWSFSFPFNLFAPIISSIWGVLQITLIYNLWKFADIYINSGINIPIYGIYTLVAIFMFILGYVRIFSNVFKNKKGKTESNEKVLSGIKKLSAAKKSNVGWNDVKKQFKDLIYNLEEQLKIILYNVMDAFNDSFETKKKRKKRR